MDRQLIQKHYTSLCQCLDEIIKVYRHLLQVVRKEKSILIAANLDELNENNRSKEAMLIKIQKLEGQRIELCNHLASALEMKAEPKLMEFAKYFSGMQQQKLMNYHSVLELLFKRVNELNKENEILVQSALANINGAMDSIRDTLADKATYKKKGAIDNQPAASGQLVSREA